MVDAIIFYIPIYRFSALLKVITALASWITVFALIRIAPRALQLPGLSRANEELRHQLSETREAEEALARSNEALESFTGLVAHDLRNPLNNAALSAEMAREASERGDNRAAAISLERVEASLRQMAVLIAELRRDSEPGDVRQSLEPVALKHVVESAKVYLAPSILESKATIRCGELPEIRGRRSMLVQVLVNLFENAIKYRGSKAPEIEVTARQESDRVILRVADRGPGISANECEHIFEPGYRGSTATHLPGSGLGLAFCQRIVTAHGGRIRAESPPGGGTVVELIFPRIGTL